MEPARCIGNPSWLSGAWRRKCGQIREARPVSGGWGITGAPDDVGATSWTGWVAGDDVGLKLKVALLGLVAVARE